MNLYKIKNIVILLITVVSVATARGQSNDSLNHYLEVAALNNPGLNADFLAYKASLERVEQAGVWSDPQLDIGFFLKPMDIVGGSQIADFTLMQMFPWFGTKKAARSEATHMAQMAYEEFRESRDMLFLEVYSQWYTLSSLKQQLKNNGDNLKLLSQLEQLARQKMSTAFAMSNDMGGSSGLSSVLRVQLEIAEIENNIESLLSEIESEKAKFNALLNRPTSIDVVVPDSIIKVPFLFNEMEAVNEIERQNPMLGMIVEEEQAYRAKSEMDKKMSYPMLGIGLQYMVLGKSSSPYMDIDNHNGMNGMDMVMPMVSISLPIYRNKYKAKQRESRYMWESAQEKYNNTLNTLQSDLFKFKQQLEDAERKITLYQKQKNLALTAYQLIIQEFVTAKSDLTNVIEVQRQLLDYKIKEAEAIADYNIKVAEINSLRSFSNTN
ncbi:MAG: TolC family protein [Bacteroidales bacterium]|nr:TolC family protein [Bacteroidales bacterium]